MSFPKETRTVRFPNTCVRFIAQRGVRKPTPRSGARQSNQLYVKDVWSMKPPDRFPPDDPREWLNRARSNWALAKNRIEVAEATVRWAEDDG